MPFEYDTNMTSCEILIYRSKLGVQGVKLKQRYVGFLYYKTMA